MIALIQRCRQASVSIHGKVTDSINTGLLVFVGIETADNNEDVEWLSQKIVNLRIFNDDTGVMNRSVKEIRGEILVVSQFTLMAGTKKGNRPSYIKAALPVISIPVYESFKEQIAKALGKKISSGTFGANMEVSLVNDGPVTIIIDTKNKQ